MMPLPTPNSKAKPTAQYRTPHRHVSKMHSIITLTDSFDRAKPASSAMNPACMKNTRNAATRTHTVFSGLMMSTAFVAACDGAAPGRGLEQVDREHDDPGDGRDAEHLPGEQEREPLLRLPLRERLDRQAFSRLSRPAPGITTRFERPECTDVCHELCHASELKNPVFPVRVAGLKAKRQVTTREGDDL